MTPFPRPHSNRVGCSRRAIAVATLLGLLIALFPGAAGAAEPDDAEAFRALKLFAEGQDRTNLTVIERKVRSALADAARSTELENRLLETLGTASSVEVRQFVCRQLRLIGTDTSVPVLSQLLIDPTLSFAARYALEGMASPAAGEALRRAIITTRGTNLVGVINSLGERREIISVAALAPLVGSRDVAVVHATVIALGKLGGEAALDQLRAVGRLYDPALAEGTAATVTLSDEVRARLDITLLFDAFLRCAESFAQTGRNDAAAALYLQLFASATTPRPQSLAALAGLVRVDPGQATPLLIKLLKGEEDAPGAVAAGLVRQLPLASANQVALVIDSLSSHRQALVLEALGDRAEPELLFYFLKSALSPDPNVRPSALRALGNQTGNPDAVRLLLGTAGGETEPLASIARASLDRIRGAEVDATLLTAVGEGPVALRAEAARSLAVRRITNALPFLTKALKDLNSPVRLAAIQAVGVLGGPTQLEALLDTLALAGDDGERNACVTAIVAISQRSENLDGRLQPLLRFYETAAPAARRELLTVLGRLGGPRALRTVTAAARDGDDALRARALEVLAAWPDATALDAVLATAKETTDPTRRTVALRGYLRMLEAGVPLAPAQQLARYQEAWGLAVAPAERKIILAGAANIADPAALKLAEPALSDPELRNEAGLAMARIAQLIVTNSPALARQTADRLMPLPLAAPVLAQAREVLELLERSEDFIPAWKMAGPFLQPEATEKELFDVAFPAEKGDATVAWRTVNAEDGVVLLEQLIGGDNRVAYLRATVNVPATAQAQLQIGSDDGVKLWLNGVVVLARNVTRGYTPGEDKIAVELKPGANVLLAKVTQGTGGWRFSCRVRAADGTKLPGLRFTAY